MRMKKPEQQQRLDVVSSPHFYRVQCGNARLFGADSSVHGSSVENILSGI